MDSRILSKALSKALSPIISPLPGAWMMRVGILLVGTFALLALFAPIIAPYDPEKGVGEAFSPPSLKHFLGTTHLGQDVFSRIVWGSRTILMVVGLAVLLSMSIGVPLGVLSGYYGGPIDRLLSVVMDSLYAFPALVLAIAIAALLGPNPFNASIAIAFAYVPTYYRIVRGQTLSLKGQLFVEAAIAMGARGRVVMARYILPNIFHSILVVSTLNVTDAILIEAGLSYLGLAVEPPTPDWGYDVRRGQQFVLNGYWWMIFFPGLAIMLLALGFGLIAEALSERLAIYQKR